MPLGADFPTRVSRYDIRCVEIYESARRHGIDDDDILHAVEHALAGR